MLSFTKKLEFKKALILKSEEYSDIIPLSANPEKWSNTLKQCVGNLPTNCLSVFDHFMNSALKGLSIIFKKKASFLITHSEKVLKHCQCYIVPLL